MPISTQIQMAADLMERELAARGVLANPADCLAMARKLYSAWTLTVDTSHLSPGEIAQRHRARYETRCNFIDGPITSFDTAEIEEAADGITRVEFPPAGPVATPPDIAAMFVASPHLGQCCDDHPCAQLSACTAIGGCLNAGNADKARVRWSRRAASAL